MVEETIKTIKETEEEAEKIIKESEEKCAAILEDAKKTAADLMSLSEAEAKKEAQTALDTEKEIGDKSIQDALAEVENDIKVLKEGARAKESEVIAAVIAELV